MLTKSKILITIILMDLLAGMEFDLFVPSFPELKAHFSLTPFWVEALLSVNFIGYFFSLFCVGGLADRYGRKSIIVIGLILFIIGSIFCLYPNCYELLLMGRFLQGAGIAAPAILSFLIIADTYPLKKQQYFMSLLNGAMNISVAIAPVIGSYITLYFHWQGNFATLLLVGLIVLIMTIFFIPTYQLPKQAETNVLQSYIPLVQSRPLMLLVIHIAFMCTPYWIFVGMAPLLYMKNLGVSLSHFGYYQGVLALIFAMGSVLFSFLINKYSQQKMLWFSNQIFITALICIALATVVDTHHPLLITLAVIPFVIGQIIPSNILYPVCLNFLPHAKAKISAMIQGGKLLLSALGLQLAGYFYQGSFQNIGIIICGFVFIAIVTLFLVIKHQKLMGSIDT
jgi:DHA1 family bicyclomycin/chloramphenicol resistance-like MFS transporter